MPDPTAIPTPSRDAGPRWYGVPLMWLVLGLPLAAVVGGLTTVAIAFGGADAVVVDDFRKDGLAINLDPRRDANAATLGVSAEVDHAGDRLVAHLAPGRAPAPSRLVVVFSHATRAELDRMVTLERTAEGTYAGPLAALEPGHWYLELTPADREWRPTADFQDRLGALELRAATRG